MDGGKEHQTTVKNHPGHGLPAVLESFSWHWCHDRYSDGQQPGELRSGRRGADYPAEIPRAVPFIATNVAVSALVARRRGRTGGRTPTRCWSPP